MTTSICSNFLLAGALLAASATSATAAPAAAAAPPHLSRVHGLTFGTSIEMSAPAPAGLDALLLVHPKDARTGAERLSLTAVLFTKEALRDSGMKDAELLDYVKTTFLGSTSAGTPADRTILGRKVTGKAIEKKIPAPSRAEIYVVGTKKGGKVVLAFVFAPGFEKEAQEAIAEACSSMRD